MEVLIRIFSHLDPVDLRDLRLVCRSWNNAVLDQSAWAKSFSNRFGTDKVFPSVTRSLMWLAEYFGRVGALRRWSKAKPFALQYQLLNSEYGRVDMIQTDFAHDRLLTYSKAFGTVSICTMTLGRNQVFIPENFLFTGILTYDSNWNYLCVGKLSGEIYVKNLMTASSSGSSRLSTTKIGQDELPLVGVRINPECDKRKQKVDIISANATGQVQFWTLASEQKGLVNVDGTAIALGSDFASSVAVVTETHIHVVDFQTYEVIVSAELGWDITADKVFCDFDLDDNNVVISTGRSVKVFHFESNTYSVAEAHVPEDVHIIDGTMQQSTHKRNANLAGGDGLLYALTLSDGSVVTFNIRGIATIVFSTRIFPFLDDRSPQNVEEYTKVALNSSVIAIGAFADWIHFYDAHLGQYLRQGTKVGRKWMRYETLPILKIQFGPESAGACGVIVSGNVVQHFRFGELAASKQKPNAPQAQDLSNRRAKQANIRAQMHEYDALEHQQQQQERLADKYNGTSFESEQEELRIAMALSASCAENGDSDEELQKALALLEQASEEPDDELSAALALSARDRHEQIHGLAEQNEGSSSFESTPAPAELHEESDDELLQRVLRLSLLEH